MKLAFSFAECVSHVSEDVHDELSAHSGVYMNCEAAIKNLEFPNERLTNRQRHNQVFFNHAVDDMESIVCDHLWAAGILIAFQFTMTPDFSVSDFLNASKAQLLNSEKYQNTSAEIEHTYKWARMCLPLTDHEQWANYRSEKLRKVHLIAVATIKHGFEFGLQVLNTLNFEVPENQINTFYDYMD